MSKIQDAINKIDEETEKTKNGAIKEIATYILDNLLTTDENADRILAKDKSLEKCYAEIAKKARNQASGNSACIRDDIVFGWVREYYNINLQLTASKTAPAEPSNVVSLLDMI